MHESLRALDLHPLAALLVEPTSGGIRHANAAAGALFRMPAGELCRGDLWRLLALPDAPARRLLAKAIRRPGETLQLPVRTAHGQVRHIEATTSRFDIAGPTALLLLLHDVDDRVRREARLTRHLELATMRTAAQALVVRNPAADALFPAFCRLLVDDGRFEAAAIDLHEADGTIRRVGAAGATPLLNGSSRLLTAPFSPAAGGVGMLTVLPPHERRGTREDDDRRAIDDLADLLGFALDQAARDEALRIANERAELALGAGRLGLFDFDVASGTGVCNADFSEMLGYDAASFALSADWLAAHLHPEDLARTLQVEREMLEGGGPDDARLEMRLRAADGNYRWILALVQATSRDASGRAHRLIGTHTDITALKENEALVERYARRAEALLELPPASERLEPTAFLRHGVDLAESLTASRIGFLHFVHEADATLDLATWSTATTAAFCGMTPASTHYPVDAAGVWADAFRRRAPVVHNDFAERSSGASLPTGHAGVDRFAVVPILDQGEVRMLLGVGNKASPYDEIDVETLRLVGDEVWRQHRTRRDATALADAHRFTTLLLDNVAEGVVACDAAGRLTMFNRAARTWHGIGPDASLDPSEWSSHYQLMEVDGTTPLPEDRIPLLRALSGETVQDVPFAIATDGAPVRHCVCTGGPIIDAAGEKVGALVVMHDVTARRKAEQAEHLQSLALNAAANAIVITDRHGAVEWANQAFCTLTGYDRDAVLGRTPAELVRSGRQSGEFYGDLWTTILAGRTWSGELVNRRADGSEYPEAMTITPVLGESGGVEHFIAIKRDLTAERALQAQLLQAQKMEGVGRLAAGVAHDFNNLLTVIGGTVELALGSLNEEDPLGDDLREIRDATRRASSLTRQLLAFSRQQVLKREVVSVNRIVADLSRMMRRLIGEDIALELALDDALPMVHADPGQLEQVLVNLTVNARDAMPHGGTLRIGTAAARFAERTVLGDVTLAAGSYVEIRVRDSGIGMDRATLARLFEPFFTTKAVGKGTGLGLATVYGIVTQSGGAIAVESAPGAGTEFRLLLPATGRQAESSTTAPAAPSRAGSARILVVDDEPGLRSVTERILTRAGHRVLVAGGPEEALAMLERDAPALDLLITDVVMPGMPGTAMAARIRADRPDLRVIYMSGYTDDRIVTAGLDDGSLVLSKPFTIDEVTRRVAEVLSRQPAGR